MTEMRAETLLVELLTEELPPKALKALGEAFASGIASGLAKRGLVGNSNTASAYATWRFASACSKSRWRPSSIRPWTTGRSARIASIAPRASSSSPDPSFP